MAGNLRSPRKRALEIGTDKSQFPKDVPYDHAAGAPSGNSGGTYSDATDGVVTPKGGGGTNPSPFGNLR